MRLIRGFRNLKYKFKKPVLTIGMFDGVHLAHRRIIKEVVRQAKILKGTSIVLTFTAHPSKVLRKDADIALITSLKHRIELIRQLDVDVCLLLDFNREFSRMPAEDFVKDILVDRLGIYCLIIGEGFRFGRKKRGTFSLLKILSKRYGFKVKKINPIKINNRIISSSRIRMLIQKGKINEVNGLLGRKFSVFGKVTKGKARGRILGYPTANITPLQESVPCRGVYAVFVKIDNKILPGILNIGFRPTFSLKEKTIDTIEVHVFNIRKNLYRKTLEVFFIQRIRPEKRFTSHQALLARIKKDEFKAKKILQTQSLP